LNETYKSSDPTAKEIADKMFECCDNKPRWFNYKRRIC